MKQIEFINHYEKLVKLDKQLTESGLIPYTKAIYKIWVDNDKQAKEYIEFIGGLWVDTLEPFGVVNLRNITIYTQKQ